MGDPCAEKMVKFFVLFLPHVWLIPLTHDCHVCQKVGQPPSHRTHGDFPLPGVLLCTLQADHDRDVYSLFRRLDTRRLGYIDEAGLIAFLRSVDPDLSEADSKAQAPQLMMKIDTNHDGVIDYDEFAAAVHGEGRGCCSFPLGKPFYRQAALSCPKLLSFPPKHLFFLNGDLTLMFGYHMVLQDWELPFLLSLSLCTGQLLDFGSYVRRAQLSFS